MDFIIPILLGLGFGCVLMFFVLRPKLMTVKEIDKRIEEQNAQLTEEANSLHAYVKQLQNDINQKGLELQEQKLALSKLRAEEQELIKHIENTRELIEQNNEVVYQKSFDLM